MPEVFADKRGVWRRDDPMQSSQGITWDEIYAVSGYPIDVIGRTLIYVELDYVYGEYFEFSNDWPGFKQVIQAITEALPSITPSWFQTIEELPLGAPMTVWQREGVTSR